jgi:hypothetical protein
VRAGLVQDHPRRNKVTHFIIFIPFSRPTDNDRLIMVDLIPSHIVQRSFASNRNSRRTPDTHLRRKGVGSGAGAAVTMR